MAQTQTRLAALLRVLAGLLDRRLGTPLADAAASLLRRIERTVLAAALMLLLVAFLLLVRL